MASRTRILDAATRTRLLELARACEVSGLTGNSKDEIIARVSHSRTIRFADLLELFSRDELKAGCRAVGLVDRGREKTLLITRLLDAES